MTAGTPAADVAARPGAPAVPGRPAPARADGPGVLRGDGGEVVAERIPNPLGDQPFTKKSSPEETARAVAEYKHANRYPPTSQLLEAHHLDLMRPNQRYEQEQPSRFDTDVQLIYSGVKNTIVGDEPIATFLRVTRDGEPAAVNVLAAQARIEQAGVQLPLVYTGGAGGYVNEFRPAQLGVDRASMIETEIWFEASPGQEESRSLSFFYTPEAAIPARFTGQFRDALEDGSLVIYAGIDVVKAGHYVIDVNLYGPADEPVMFSRHKDPLPAGRSEVRLLFFGKALRDRGVAPPFHLGQLRGGRVSLDADPDTESMPLADWRYTTKTRFSLDDLSDAEWDSEHKRDMIRFLETHGTKPGRDPAPP